MGFLSTMGWLIIGLTSIGFLVGIYESVQLANGIVALISLFGLLAGVYVGYLGPRIEDLENTSPSAGYSHFDSLEKRIGLLEAKAGKQTVGSNQGPPERVEPQQLEEIDRARRELAELQERYADTQPSLSPYEANALRRQIQEVGHRLHSLESQESDSK